MNPIVSTVSIYLNGGRDAAPAAFRPFESTAGIEVSHSPYYHSDHPRPESTQSYDVPMNYISWSRYIRYASHTVNYGYRKRGPFNVSSRSILTLGGMRTGLIFFSVVLRIQYFDIHISPSK